jgi:nucleoside phosphorylase
VTGEYLTAPGLQVLVFLAGGSQDTHEGWNRLRFLWDGVTGQFRLDRPVPLLAVPPDVPAEHVAPAGESALLAAAERGGAPGWRASAWADHGILGLTVMMTAPRDGAHPSSWTDLEHVWEAATAGLAPEDVLGEARIFLARPSSSSPSYESHEPHDAVPVGAAGEILVWEIEPGSRGTRIVRRLAAVATAEPERQLAWANRDGTLTPLARHLLHAARLRDQIRTFDEGRRSRQLRDELGLLVAGGSGNPAALRPAHAAAIALRAEIDELRHLASAVADDLAKALDPPVSGAEGGPLGQDRQLATWFGRRLDDEIARLDAAVRNAQPALRRQAAKPQLPAIPPPASPASAIPPSAIPPSASPASAIPPAASPAPVSPPAASPASVSSASAGLETRPPQRRTSSPEPWAVVFTALEVEYTAVRAYLDTPVRQHEERGTLYEVGKLPGVHGDWRIALTQTGPGSTMAALQFDRAVRVFAPEIALFLGVAGGRKDVALGDVVVADMIYDYEVGKSTLEGFQPRIRVHYPAHRLLQRAQLVARENRWQQRIRPNWSGPPPASFVKPIVTGGKVVVHHQSATALLLDQYADDALAVETEGHGFLAAAYVNPGVDALVIRGISDLLAGKDQVSDDYWQPVASRHAAAFAIELLDSIGSART